MAENEIIHPERKDIKKIFALFHYTCVKISLFDLTAYCYMDLQQVFKIGELLKIYIFVIKSLEQH
jgi:hypothetical protein